jgi:sugar-phosphatase
MKQLECQAIIFDLDGVLIDSSAVIERSWRRWAEAQGLDGDVVMRVVPGRRMVEAIRLLAPHLDAVEEARRLEAREGPDTLGLVQVPAAAQLTAWLPPRIWAVVTSGTRLTALTRLAYAGVPVPAVLVTADDVTHGKPHPEAYLLAAEQLNVAPVHCLVVEDAPAGIQAARAAGMWVVALATTHARDALAEADAIAGQLGDIRIALNGDAGSQTTEGSGALLRVIVSW